MTPIPDDPEAARWAWAVRDEVDHVQRNQLQPLASLAYIVKSAVARDDLATIAAAIGRMGLGQTESREARIRRLMEYLR